jgi:hypothetical protein
MQGNVGFRITGSTCEQKHHGTSGAKIKIFATVISG